MFVNSNQPVPLRIIVFNNRGHLINLHSIITANNIRRIELQKMLLCLINTEVKNNITMVTLIVEYQNPPENIFYNPL